MNTARDTVASESESLASTLEDAIWSSEGSLSLDEIQTQQSLATFLRQQIGNQTTTRRSA